MFELCANKWFKKIDCLHKISTLVASFNEKKKWHNNFLCYGLSDFCQKNNNLNRKLILVTDFEKNKVLQQIFYYSD